MSRSSNARRPYVRQTKSITRRASEELLNKSGLAPMERPRVELLEPRKMLFSLTIDGTLTDEANNAYAEAYFAYFVPYFQSPEVADDPDQIDPLLEDFNDDAVGNINPQRVLTGSDILVTNGGAQRLRISAPTDGQGQTITDQTVLETQLGLQGQSFSLITLSDPTQTGGVRNVYTNASFNILTAIGNLSAANNFGLLNGGLEIEMVFQGAVQRTYTQAQLATQNANGSGTFNLDAQGGEIGVFDEIRFVQTQTAFVDPGVVTAAFLLDDISLLPPSERFVPIVDPRVFGAYIRITGEVGATAQVLDLYGREMRDTIQLGSPGGNVNFVFGDFNGNGIPEYNDGIGQINLANFGDDPSASVYITGGNVVGFGAGAPPPTAEDVEGTFAWDFGGLSIIDEFEQGAGHGFFLSTEDPQVVVGLPEQAAQLVIGSPYDRPINGYNPDGRPLGNGGNFFFTNPEQGVFLTDGSSIGDVGLNAVLYGSSNFAGSVGVFSTGVNYGNLSVAGDLEAFVVATDAGVLSRDLEDATSLRHFSTNAELLVGRTLREFVVGGKNLMSVIVDGDLSNPNGILPNDVLVYQEREIIHEIDPATPDPERVFLRANREGYLADSTISGLATVNTNPSISRSVLFADSSFRNDTILSAEFVNSPSTAVILQGSTGAQDTISTGEDAGDVFGIAVDGTRDIVIESVSFTSSFTTLIRILDSEGRTVAANTSDVNTAFGNTFTYTPEGPGVYYVVINHGQTVVDFAADTSYSILVSGLAPTTFGSYRSALGFGSGGEDTRNTAADGDFDRPVVVVNSGNVGAVRVGTGYVDATGTESSSAALINTAETNDDDIFQMSGFSFSSQGSLFNITAGGDISSNGNFGVMNDFTVGGDFGSLYTGLSLVQDVGGGVTEGDLGSFSLLVGGRVGLIHVAGSIAVDQDMNDSALGAEPVLIRTGLDQDLRGDIGLIWVGGHIAGDQLTVDTSATAGSVVGGLLVSQNVAGFGGSGGDNVGIFDGFEAINLNLGQDSDIRFVDIPRIDLLGSSNNSLPIMTGETLVLVDDAGGRVEISVTAREVFSFEIGRVYIVPVDGSEGVAIARIEIDSLIGTGVFTGGRTLRIRGENGQGIDDIISIGRIVITNSDAFSSIEIDGSAQIDVWRIDAPGGLNLIDQDTPDGDIVSIDTASLTTLRIHQGDLGRTQVPAWGPSQIGPNLGLQSGENNAVEMPFGINPQLIDGDWNGQIFRPSNNSTVGVGQAFLDDVGSPFDGFLNGLLVRTGGIGLVEVAGGVGDIISQDAAADILTVQVNDDNTTELGEFDGIFGTIYSARSIQLIEIGDGLVGPGSGPMASAGIFAGSVILTIRDNVNDSNIEGVISAGNIIARNGGLPVGVGITRVELTRGGGIRDAHISTSARLDEFWASTLYGNDGIFTGQIDDIIVRDGDIFRSQIITPTLDTLTIQNGFYDATDLNVLNTVVGNITAAGFRNSTIGGNLLEFRLSRIQIGEDLERLVVSDNGNFSDTQLSVTGSIVRNITAHDFIRANIAVANIINAIDLSGSMLASTITAGQLVALTATDSIRTSTIIISGPLETLTVGNEISRTDITVSGPDGRIDSITVLNTLDAQITSSGPIGSIRSTAADVRGSVVTTTPEGDITLISAFRDLAIETDIGGDLDQLVAGRNIGTAASPSVILVRGDVGLLDVSGGRLFSDLRVGNSVTSVLLGATTNLPSDAKAADGDIEAFGRIFSVSITGDYDGKIVSESGGIGTITVTNGSLLQEAAIIARDGGIGSIVIVAGHLLGNVFADQTIGLIRVEASADGVFGDVGINPGLSSGVASADSTRNQLPPGVVATAAIDGPAIISMRGINRFIVTGGSVFDAVIYAGTNIGLIDVTGNIQSDGQQADDDSVTIAAGDQIQVINVSGNVSDTLFIAGLETFGSMPLFDILDPTYTDRPGGTGAATDVVGSGRIQEINIGGSASDVTFSAGMTAGADGIYGTGDERHVVGFSFVNDLVIGGARTNVTVSADRKFYTLNGQVITPVIQDADGTLNNAGRMAANEGGLLESLTGAFVGAGVNLGNLGIIVNFGTTSTFAWNGTTFTVEVTSTEAGAANADPARGVIWDGARGRLILANTRLADGVIVSVVDDGNPNTPLPDLIDFDIVSNDEASLGLVRINGNLRGGSDIIVDNYVRTVDLDDYDGTGQILIGADVASFTIGRFAGGSISANFVESLDVTQSFVVSSGSVPSVSLTGAGTFTVAGNVTAVINVERSITQIFNVGGTVSQALIRAGGSITNITADQISRTRISVANVLGSLNVASDVFDTSILAGGDLGSDAQIGTGGDATTVDRTTSGTIGAVNIGGNFFESDIVAGFLRGPDGFFGTDDDTAASGISSVGNVTIDGTGVGSNANSESYTISAAGSLAFVTVGGTEAQSTGNFTVDPFTGEPLPIQVLNFSVLQDARSYAATFTFNQEINISTFVDALSVREVVSEGNFIDLVNPTTVPGSGDFSVDFDVVNRMATLTVSRSVTDRDLVDNGDGTFSRPVGAGAGVYRISLDSNVFRSRVSQARLDGDGDGFATENDHFSVDDIIGDAGDAAGPRAIEQVDVNGDGSLIVDYFDAISLDQVFDSNSAPDGVPDSNSAFTLRGALGDHPDRDLDVFGFGGDIDVYSLTLQAGQILQLGQIEGASFEAIRSVFFQPTGNATPELVFTQQGSGFNANVFQQLFGVETARAIPLPVQPSEVTDRSDPGALLIKESGSYYIVLEAGQNPSTSWFTPGAVSNINIQPNQIGNYAFTIEVFDDSNSGFSAGGDSGDGTKVIHAPPLSLFADPTDEVVIDDYTFSRLAGADGVFGNGDDIVTGTSNDGQLTSTRDGTRLTNTISSSLGDSGVTGLPGQVESDVDVWHLNNRQPVAPGTAMTITVKLADIGGDLGSSLAQNNARFSSLADFTDFTKNVQFALFDTTNSFNIDDANLVFSPTDFEARASAPNTIIAENGPNRYGFDENGDFFISFVIPPALGGAVNASGTYAVYLQGAFRSDYEIEIVTQGTGSQQVRSQNVLIETAGGVLDWLTVDGAAVTVEGFEAASLGFAGRVNNIPVEDFILSELVTSLNNIYATAGLDVTFSTNPSDFEFEEFSTVFLSSGQNPIGLIVTTNYGLSEHSDPFNSDREDEAVVFTPDLATLGYTPSAEDLDSFIESLTAATGRRVGELVGLRLTDPHIDSGDLDLFNSFGVNFTPLGFSDYDIQSDSRSLASHLSGINDTGFYLGQQSSLSLLERILSN